jgi:hypothetical protein
LKLSTNSKQAIAENANHMVMYGQPDTIIQAIRERVFEVRYPDKKQPAWTPNPTVAPNQLPLGAHDRAEGQVYISSMCEAWGWAADPDDRAVDLTVRVLSDGKEVATQVANGYREDVFQAEGCPGGTCAFQINLADVITHKEWHTIVVQAQDLQNGAWVNLFFTPKQLNCQ